MSSEYSKAALSTIYDRVVEISNTACLVESKGKVGVINTLNGDVVIPIKYTRNSVWDEENLAILIDEHTGMTVAFNGYTGNKCIIPGIWLIGSVANGLIFLHEIATYNKRKKTVVIRKDLMKIIVNPTDITLIYTDLPDNKRAALRYFNDGFCIDGVLYYIMEDYRIVVDKDTLDV